MIVKGKARANGRQLARYLLSDKNEKVEVREIRGLFTDDIYQAFDDVEIIADGTRCQKPFYHTQFRTPAGETLTPEQWIASADLLEKRLGMEGYDRVIVMHTKDGHEHMHVVWNRINENLHAAHLSNDWYICKDVARELEREFGLQRVSNSKRSEREAEHPSNFNEDQQARRLGRSVQETRDTIRACWEHSDNGQSFAAALESEGYWLARGDRRDYVAVAMEDGGTYSLGKRTTGATAAEVRAKLQDIERERLPTVAEARDWLEVRRDLADPHGMFKTVVEPSPPAPAPKPREAEPPPSREASGASFDARKTAHAASSIGEGAARVVSGVVEGVADLLFGGGSPAPEHAPPSPSTEVPMAGKAKDELSAAQRVEEIRAKHTEAERPRAISDTGIAWAMEQLRRERESQTLGLDAEKRREQERERER